MSDFGIVPDTILRSALVPNGGFGVRFEFKQSGVAVVPSSSKSFTTSKAEAIPLAERILCAFAPEKLASSVPKLAETYRFDHKLFGHARIDRPGPVRIGASRVADGSDLAWARRERLKGVFINVVEGAKAPTKVFGNLATAEAEADRLAVKAPGTRVLTLRIESAREAKTTVTIQKD